MSNRFEHLAGTMARAMPRRTVLGRLGWGSVAAGMMFEAESRDAGAQSAIASAATEAAARRAINAINQALASGDMAFLDLAFAPGYVNHTPRRSLQSGQLATGDLAGLETSLTELRAAVPNAVLVVNDVVAAGDTAAVRFTFRGTIDPAMVTLPEGSSSRLAIGGVAYGRIVDGQVIESWDYDEAAELLGPLTRPTPTPTPAPTAEPTIPPVAGGEARDVSDFQEVSLEGIGTLEITQGDTESLSIEAEEKVLNRIESVVRGGKLTIRPARSFRTEEPVIYHLSVKQIAVLELSGAGGAVANQLTAEAFRLSVTGSGTAQVSQLTATTLEVTGNGSAAIQIGGTVDQQTVTLTGTATYDARGLGSRVATISADGAAQAVVSVSEDLMAKASAASRIEYLGDPAVQQDVSAAASVTKAG